MPMAWQIEYFASPCLLGCVALSNLYGPMQATRQPRTTCMAAELVHLLDRLSRSPYVALSDWPLPSVARILRGASVSFLASLVYAHAQVPSCAMRGICVICSQSITAGMGRAFTQARSKLPQRLASVL